MMTDRESLLGAVAQRHAYSLEDAATDALTFILSRRASAREALSEFLKDDAGRPLATANVISRASVESVAQSRMWSAATSRRTRWHSSSPSSGRR